MKKNILRLLLIFSFFILIVPCRLFAADSTTPEPYETDEFPQSLKDLRRFEIVSLGAMPFVTLDTTLVYSGYKSITTGSSFNPFGSSSYTQDEQLKIIATSLGISCGVGLTDFIYNLIKRNIKHNVNPNINNSTIIITPIEEDPDAIKIEALHQSSENSESELSEEN